MSLHMMVRSLYDAVSTVDITWCQLKMIIGK